MLNLFSQENVIQLASVPGGTPTRCSISRNVYHPVRLATFGTVQGCLSAPRDSAEDAVHARLVLYTEDYRLLLCQFTDQEGPQGVGSFTAPPTQVWVPLDSAKGHIISMCLNAQATSLLALTSHSYVYLVPLHFTLSPDPETGRLRASLLEDARTYRCRSLKSPSSLTWWQRQHALSTNSLAIVGTTTGQLLFLDLTTDVEVKQLTVPFAIESLSIFEESTCQTLLITCSNRLQYHLTLEQFRASLGALPPSVSGRRRKSTTSTTSTTSSGSYLLSCMLSYPLGGASFEEDESPTNALTSILDSTEFRPQLVTISEDPLGSSLPAPSTSPPATFTTSSQTEFLDLLEDTVKMSVHPQRHTRSVLLVKTNKPKYDFASGGGGVSLGRSLTDVDALSSLSGDSNYSDLTNSFCSVALNRDLSFDVHELAAVEFSSKCILPSNGKLFLVGIEGQENPPKTSPRLTTSSSSSSSSGLLKILDCGHRFLLLAFPGRVSVVSKYFSEQRTYQSASSPRSPLLLKKSDSHRATGGGSFRRKHYHHSSSGGSGSSGQASGSVIAELKVGSQEDEEEEDEIVNVFLVSSPSTMVAPDFSSLTMADYPLPSGQLQGPLDVEVLLRSERAAVSTKLSSKVSQLISMDERFLVVTRRRVWLLACKQPYFGDFFHQEILSLLELVDSDAQNVPAGAQAQAVDGDVITRAKFLVDCFVSRSLKSSLLSSAAQSHPCQSWTFWLTRSALLLMEQLSKGLGPGEEPPWECPETAVAFARIFRLFELARTPRRRVITALTFFGFWSRALFYLRKYFETRILQELPEEERTYLAHQMLDCLLERHARALSKKEKKEAEGELTVFLRSYRAYYQLARTLAQLLDRQLWKMARIVALVHSQYLLLVEILLSKLQHAPVSSHPKESRTQVLDLLTSARLPYTLLLSTQYSSLHPKAQSPPVTPVSALEAVLSSSVSIHLLESYLDFVLKSLPHLSSTELARLANVLQPHRFAMQLLVTSVLERCNQTYLRNHQASQVIDSFLPIRKRDLLHLYVFVLLLCLRKCSKKGMPSSTSLYDWTFLERIKTGKMRTEEEEDPSAVNLEASAAEESTYCVSAGTYHSVAFESPVGNSLFLWGKFPFVPADPRTPATAGKHLRTPVSISFFSSLLPGVIIREVATGHQHTLVLTDVGLFTLGSSAFGQLGLGSLVLESRYPMPVEAFQSGSGRKVMKIAAGSYHSLAITEEGDLYSWGWGLHGQLGHGAIEDEVTPRRVAHWKDKSTTIVDVAAGYAHTVAMTNAGDVYVFGENSYSQLGLAEGVDSAKVNPGLGKVKLSVPQLLPASTLPGQVRLIACGLFHTVILVTGEEATPGQRLFCWGLDPKTWRVKMKADRAQGGKMAKANSNNSTTPPSTESYSRIREISLDKVTGAIRKMVAGQSHTLVLTEDGRCYTFGYGREGQLGLGAGIGACPLEAEPILELEAVVDIAAGAAHSLAVNTEGTVWGWGQNGDYQLDSLSNSLLDQGTAAQGSCAPESRRNSLLSSLMRGRGQEDSLVRGLLSLQKNIEWLPVRLHVPLVPRETQRRQLLKEELKPLRLPLWRPVEPKNGDTIKEQLMDVLVRYRDILDLKSSLKRFDTFDYPQMSALVCHFAGEHTLTYSYQLQALKQEIGRHLETLKLQDEGKVILIQQETTHKWIQEMVQLTVYFLTVRHGQSVPVPAGEAHRMVSALVQLWTDLKKQLDGVSVSDFSLKRVIEKVFFDEESTVDSPYFGLALFQVLKEQTLDRRELSLDDKFLLALLQRTKASVERHPKEMVAVQKILEGLIETKRGKESSDAHDTNCPNRGADGLGLSAVFPLELSWRSLLRQFTDEQENPSLTVAVSAMSDLEDEALEVQIPEDLYGDTEGASSMLYLFACGHCLTRAQLRDHEPPAAEEDAAYQETIVEILETSRSELIANLRCPPCQLQQQTSAVLVTGP